jgi:hypothetical protein
MSKEYCRGDTPCDAKRLCDCLPKGVEYVGGHTINREGIQVRWCNIPSDHCKTIEEAFEKAYERNATNVNKHDKYDVVRITTIEKTEYLKFSPLPLDIIENDATV